MLAKLDGHHQNLYEFFSHFDRTSPIKRLSR
jgi:hypothetical protein